MLKHIIAISFVYLCAALAWVVLGAAMQFRTLDQDDKLRQSVEQIWGAPQVQTAPTAYWVEEDQQHSLALHSSRVDVDLALDHRRNWSIWSIYVEAASAQLVYLVLFSSAFFFEGYAGLAITSLAIATLFAAMQLTGRLDWDRAFAGQTTDGATQ